MKQTARADMKAGTLYAVVGENGWTYYGQVTPDKRIGFFRCRDHGAFDPVRVLVTPIMAVVGVSVPSITRALRAGAWTKLGRYEIVNALREPWGLVQWSVGTLDVGVSEGGRDYETRIDDPAIQQLEVIASWDAEEHIPLRLTVDFGQEAAAWHVGGPVWRERRVMEEQARRSPDAPWHQLPPDWVSTDVR